MTDAELMSWDRERERLFGGGADAAVIALVRSRVSAYRIETARAALSDYACMHGGSRARFFPSFFFVELDKITKATEEKKREHAQASAIAERSAADRRATTVVEADWLSRRLDIAAMSDAAYDAAYARLRAYAWPAPPVSLDAWPRSWLLAMSDIARNVDTLWISQAMPPPSEIARNS